MADQIPDGNVAADLVAYPEDVREDMRRLLEKSEDLKQGITRLEARVEDVYNAVMQLLQAYRDQGIVGAAAIDDMDDGDSNSCITDDEK